MLLSIVTGAKTPILRTVCKPVEKFDKSLKSLVQNLKDTMLKAKGLGIAAPQVGENARVFLVTIGHSTKNPVILPMINPEITYLSDEVELGEEGCLSLPDEFGDVARSTEVIVEFCDLKGTSKSLRLAGLDARVVQHENDHLNGVLFIDKTEKRRVM